MSTTMNWRGIEPTLAALARAQQAQREHRGAFPPVGPYTLRVVIDLTSDRDPDVLLNVGKFYALTGQAIPPLYVGDEIASDIGELLEGLASEGVTVRRVRYHAEGDEQ